MFGEEGCGLLVGFCRTFVRGRSVFKGGDKMRHDLKRRPALPGRYQIFLATPQGNASALGRSTGRCLSSNPGSFAGLAAGVRALVSNHPLEG